MKLTPATFDESELGSLERDIPGERGDLIGTPGYPDISASPELPRDPPSINPLSISLTWNKRIPVSLGDHGEI